MIKTVISITVFLYTLDMLDKNLSCQMCQAPICISQIHLFRRLTPQQSQLIVSLIQRYSYKKGEIVIHQGDKSDAFSIVTSGRFKAYTVNEEGKAHLLYTFQTGQFFGQEALFEAQEMTYTVEAMEDSTLCKLSLETLKKLIYEYPDLGFNLLAEMNDRIQSLEKELTTHSTELLIDRLHKFLWDIAKDYGKDNGTYISIHLPYSQEDMAMRLGTSRESINRTLKSLEKQRKLKLEKRKEILLYKM